MEKKPEQIHPDQWLKDLPQHKQSEAFKPEELLVCPECERRSPPNRIRCFYCNAELPAASLHSVKPKLRRLESWEKGFNVIYSKNISNEKRFQEIADLTGLEREAAENILCSNKPLPIARAESEREAEIVVQRLNELGVEAFVLSDEKLQIETVSRRLRGIEFFDDKLILVLFNADRVIEIAREDLSLIVAGVLYERKIESIEKLHRRKENQILETSETSNDEMVIDLYGRIDPVGCRIESKGFDFSCLGAEKNLLARENMKILAEKLREFAPKAKFDDEYGTLRREINHVWETTQRKDSRGIQKKGFGKPNLESVFTVDNLQQFTRYSRLQQHLL